MTDNLSKSATVVKDPVCGMSVNPATAKHRLEHAGKTYYFCCGRCADKFKADPEKYLTQPTPPLQILPAAVTRSSAHQATYVCPMCPQVRESKPGPCPKCGMTLDPEMPPAGGSTEYTCPMHPEIVRPAPGSCPICGMALEPRTVTATEEENPELRDMTRRFWISLAFTTPLMAIAMGSMLGYGVKLDLDINGFLINLARLELVLATPVVLWCGWPFFQRFWTSLVNRSPNMFTLIGMGTGVAYGYSVVATLLPQIFPP